MYFEFFPGRLTQALAQRNLTDAVRHLGILRRGRIADDFFIVFMARSEEIASQILQDIRRQINRRGVTRISVGFLALDDSYHVLWQNI